VGRIVQGGSNNVRRFLRRRYRKLARTAQSAVPWVREPKHRAQATVRGLLKRPHEAEFALLAAMAFHEGACAIDVGANRGQSIDSIRCFQASVPIEAFEPQQQLADLLRRRYASDPAVTVHRCALGAEAGELVLYTPVYCGYEYDGGASTVRSGAEGYPSHRSVYFFRPHRLELREQRVPVARLDDLGLVPAFVKIDVQGAEAEVLRGGMATLAEHRPVVLIEDPPASLVSELAALGYSPRWWTPSGLTADPVTRANTILVPTPPGGTGWHLEGDDPRWRAC
jgi:FkbM family methyltransferase